MSRDDGLNIVQKALLVKSLNEQVARKVAEQDAKRKENIIAKSRQPQFHFSWPFHFGRFW